MGLEFSPHILEKYSNTKFQENPSNGSRLVLYGRTDGQKDRYDEANSQFCNFANAPKMNDLEID
jgi:hypothetical protein